MIGKNIYLDFESAYDLRLGAVSIIDDDIAGKLLAHPDYKLRISDEFSYIFPDWNDKLFSEEYNKKDLLTLLKAPMTELLMQFGTVLSDLRYSIGVISEEQEERPIIYLNYYPFHELTEPEKEMFVDAIRAVCGGWFDYKMIYIRPEEMTLGWIFKSRIGLGFIYDFQTFDANCLNGISPDNIPVMPQTSLTFARRTLSREKLKPLVEYRNNAGDGIDPFIAQTSFRAQFFGVRWKGLDLFSAADIKLHLQ